MSKEKKQVKKLKKQLKQKKRELKQRNQDIEALYFRILAHHEEKDGTVKPPAEGREQNMPASAKPKDNKTA